MATVNLGNGVTLENASGEVVERDGAGRRSMRAVDFVSDEFTALIDGALNEAECTVAADAIIAPEEPGFGRRSLDDEPDGPPTIRVEVEAEENAALLVEDTEGVFHWQFAHDATGDQADRRDLPAGTLTFELVSPAAGGDDAGGRRSLGGAASWLGRKLIAPVRVRVVRFLASATIDEAVKRIESSLEEGLLLLDGSADQWQANRTPPVLDPGQPIRVLLLIHGTFSSTLGSFAAMDSGEATATFLDQAIAQYDLVLGFDHKTLARTPEENADDIVAALAFLPAGSCIDMIGYSRGGLVLRCFHDKAQARFTMGQSVFVGCTNRGTLLAEPDNWRDLLDLYTNIGLAGGRALTLLGSPVAGNVVSQLVKLLGGFVRALPQIAIKENKVPGLAAMEPDSQLVNRLAQAPFPVHDAYAIISDFEPRPIRLRGLTGGLAKHLADRFTDRLMRKANDLVVHSASMTDLGSNGSIASDRVHTYAPEEAVYHTIYFHTPPTLAMLANWLFSAEEMEAMEEAGPDESDSAPRRRDIHVDLPDPRGGDRPRAIPPTRASIEPEMATVEDEVVEEEATVQPAPVGLYFAAEMNPTPRVGGFAPIFLTISRKALRRAAHAAAAGNDEEVEADPTRPLDVAVLAIENCRIWSDDGEPATADPAGELAARAGSSVVTQTAVPERSDILRFLVEGVEPGRARIQIEVTQGPVGLVSFIIEPVFVSADTSRLLVEQNVTPVQPTAQSPAALRIYEQNVPGVGLVIKYDLVCIKPPIAVSEEVILPSSFSVEAFAADFLKALNDAWQLSGEQYDNFLQRISAYSVNRTNELLPIGIRRALWDQWDDLHTIQVFSENAHIPWELLYVDDPEGLNPRDEGFLGQRGLIRWVYNAPIPDDRIVVRSDKVRFVIPDYSKPKMKLVYAAKERKMLEDTFPGASAIEPSSTAVIDFLRNKASDCDLLHFTCHGDTANRAVMHADLLMQGISGAQDQEVQDRLSSDIVKRYARFAEGQDAAIVFVNACKTGQTGPSIAGVSGFADAFLRPNGRKGAAGFIGALWSIDDELALDFAESFYTAMFEQRLTLVEAVKAARAAAIDRSDFTWLAYTVYGNPNSRFADQ